MTKALSTDERTQRAAFLSRLRAEYSTIYGAVYIDHFTAAIGNSANPKAQARHYTGFVEGETPEQIAAALEERNRQHASGNGARIMRAVTEQGLTWYSAKIWRFVPKRLELDLKESYKNARKLCPICSGQIQAGDAPVVVDAEIEQLLEWPGETRSYADRLESWISMNWRTNRVQFAPRLFYAAGCDLPY